MNLEDILKLKEQDIESAFGELINYCSELEQQLTDVKTELSELHDLYN